MDGRSKEDERKKTGFVRGQKYMENAETLVGPAAFELQI